eukprot:357992-Chlamydomonas_euryale.AAC.2
MFALSHIHVRTFTCAHMCANALAAHRDRVRPVHGEVPNVAAVQLLRTWCVRRSWAVGRCGPWAVVWCGACAIVWCGTWAVVWCGPWVVGWCGPRMEGKGV